MATKRKPEGQRFDGLVLSTEQEWGRRAQYFARNMNNHAMRRYGISERLAGRAVARLRGACAYCGGPQTSWDHVVPLCRGGANTVANLVPSCLPCNRFKGKRTAEEFARGDRVRTPRRMVPCACGCGVEIETPDHQCRPRRYISGHNMRRADVA